ncbi:hypothetical protein KJ758_03660 [Patescibacteria group bacterium]|nr:hypothetical protein [Patescibacteria group bacterium]
MWEEVTHVVEDKKETQFFIDWVNLAALTPKYKQQAEDLFLQVANRVPELATCRTTPQSAPWHVEGPTVSDGIIRMLATIFAIVDGAGLLHIEEFVRHKDLEHEIRELEETIRERAATLQAYACVHDIAKASTASFSAPAGSKGEQEGFSKHRYRLSDEATEKEKALYLKLLKAFHSSHQDLSVPELMAAFYDQYEISVHYLGHAKKGAGADFFEARENVADFFRLPEDDRVLLTFMTRYHMDVLDFFTKGTNEQKFELMTSRANKAGLDGDDALDAMLAATFLDSTVGSLAYKDGTFFIKTEAIFNWLYSEQRAIPLRRARRIEEANRREKKKLMQILEKSALSPEEVFTMLNVTFGPERGQVMEEIYALVRDRGRKIDFGDKTPLIAGRIGEARKLFDQKGSS